MEFPYQIVVFFDKIPVEGELVYLGSNGWFPHVAIKRRFGLVGIDEATMLSLVGEAASETSSFNITFLKPIKPAHMPVEVTEVKPNQELLGLHKLIIRTLGNHIHSKYPSREDDNYYPHMTIEWKGQAVVDSSIFVRRSRKINHLWVLKDIEELSDSKVIASFDLVG